MVAEGTRSKTPLVPRVLQGFFYLAPALTMLLGTCLVIVVLFNLEAGATMLAVGATLILVPMALELFITQRDWDEFEVSAGKYRAAWRKAAQYDEAISRIEKRLDEVASAQGSKPPDAGVKQLKADLETLRREVRGDLLLVNPPYEIAAGRITRRRKRPVFVTSEGWSEGQVLLSISSFDTPLVSPRCEVRRPDGVVHVWNKDPLESLIATPFPSVQAYYPKDFGESAELKPGEHTYRWSVIQSDGTWEEVASGHFHVKEIRGDDSE